MIAETLIYQVGAFTVRQQPRFDNPAFAQFLIFLGDVLIGKQFSIPCESDCLWLNSCRLKAQNAMYAEPKAPWVYGFTAKTIARHARQKNKSSLIPISVELDDI